MTERLNVPEAELAEALVLAARVIVEQKDRADAAEALLAELQALAEDFRVKELAAQHRWVQAEVRLAEAQAEIMRLKAALAAECSTSEERLSVRGGE